MPRSLKTFVKNDSLVIILDGICKRYGQRPSDIVCIDDRIIAINFDAAIAFKGAKYEHDEMEKQTGKDKKKKPKWIPPAGYSKAKLRRMLRERKQNG